MWSVVDKCQKASWNNLAVWRSFCDKATRGLEKQRDIGNEQCGNEMIKKCCSRLFWKYIGMEYCVGMVSKRFSRFKWVVWRFIPVWVVFFNRGGTRNARNVSRFSKIFDRWFFWTDVKTTRVVFPCHHIFYLQWHCSHNLDGIFKSVNTRIEHCESGDSSQRTQKTNSFL